MKRRQQGRRAVRRAHHNERARQDLPAFTLDQASFERVNRAHIVPKSFQAPWAVHGKVTVHVLDEVGSECTVALTSIADAATRRGYYRRTQPDGTEIDDTEASLALVESEAAPRLRRVLTAETPPAIADKGGLAQFIGLQLVRGPRFFDQRLELIDEMLRNVPPEQFTVTAVRAAGGDIDTVRTRVRDLYASSTEAHVTMLATALKLAMVIGNMRWELIRFDEPILAYSDHPVYVWPGLAGRTEARAVQSLGPLGAVEVLVPLGPDRLLLANWLDLPDRVRSDADEFVAGQVNALIIAQAERQWMHRPNVECPIADGPFTPLTRRWTPAYGEEIVKRSRRRVFAAQELRRNGKRRHLKQVRLLDVQPRAGAISDAKPRTPSA